MRCGGYPLCAHSASPRSARAKICHSGAPRISVAAGTDKGLDELFLIFRKHHISGRHFAPSSARAGAGDWRHGVRRRAAHRGQRKCPDRECDAGRGRHNDRTGRQGRRRSRARRCHAREPGSRSVELIPTRSRFRVLVRNRSGRFRDIMQDQKFLPRAGSDRIRTAPIVAELHERDPVVELLHDRADLPACKSLGWKVRQQCHHVQK